MKQLPKLETNKQQSLYTYSLGSKFCSLKNYLILIAILMSLIQQSKADIFCSAYCAPKQCSGTAPTACTGCSNPFTLTGALCQLAPNSGYVIIGQSQVNQFATGNTLTLNVSLGTQTCSGFTFFGNLTDSSRIKLTSPVGTASPHFKLHLIFFAVMNDDWNSNAKIMMNLIGTSHYRQRQRDDQDQKDKLCGQGSKQDDKFRIWQSFPHSEIDDTIPIQFQIYISGGGGGWGGWGGGGNDQWGVKQFILMAQLCHPACTACWSQRVDQCTACQDETPMYLSGNTCNETCLNGYGFTDFSNVCVLCDQRCQICFNQTDNCTACTPTGTWASFLVAVNFSCVGTCPNGFFGNTTNRICEPCDIECTTCRLNSSYCLSCNVTLGFGWNNYQCHNPCPIGTFVNLGGANCTSCNSKCIACQNSSTQCFNCTLTGPNQAYYFLNVSNPLVTCFTNCPIQYYKENYSGAGPNECLPCDISCFQCTSSPVPCTICNQEYFLYQAACGTTCPAEYFGDIVTWTCLLCQTNCTILTIDMKFPNAMKQKIWVDFNFTEDINFTTFPYQTFQTFDFDDQLINMQMFTVSFQITSNSSYRVILQPLGYIFLYNVTVTVTTMDMPTPQHSAINQRPFRPDNYQKSDHLSWFLIVSPDTSQLQEQIITALTNISDSISNFTTQPWIQEIKKSGVFNYLASGAQITSASILVNNIPSQNFYEGVRIWASFVFFDAPAWEQGSFKVKQVFSPTVNNLTEDARMLFDLDTIQFRFYRTGHTTFFIFDVYLQILLIVVCWILLIIVTCIRKFYSPKIKNHMGKIFAFVHKTHEICIMYIGISTLLQWTYFDAASVQRWVSLGICLLANLYFLGYQLFIYYDMIKYPAAKIGDEKYQTYVIRYGSLLKNIRYEQYDIKQAWSPKQWFRPYNYHILSFYKKFLMMAALPLFYGITHAQISVLMLIQTLEILRFIFTWPFQSKVRNIIRICLQFVLLGFFATVLIQGIYVQEIMLNKSDTIQAAVNIFYRCGWAGFALCFIFNISFIVIMIVDIVFGCRMSNREMMDQARRIYYFDKLKTYEVQNQDVPLGLVNKWVKLGNLNKRDYDDLPDINLRIELFRIAKVPNGYDVEVKKLLELYMNIEFNFHKQNNITIGKKMNKKFTLTPYLSPSFYNLIHKLFQKYDSHGVQYICLKTFQKIQQCNYKPGDKIIFKPEEMTQTVEVESYTAQKKMHRLSKRLEGFPIAVHDLQVIDGK